MNFIRLKGLFQNAKTLQNHRLRSLQIFVNQNVQLLRSENSYKTVLSVLKILRSGQKPRKATLMFTLVSSLGLAGYGYSSGFSVQDPMFHRLEETVSFREKVYLEGESQPLVYDIQAIQTYWLARPLEVFGRGVEILSVLLPYLTKLAIWECLIRRKILSHEGLQRKYAVELREALTELGPSFVKFGQALSIRPDVLPSVFLVELQKLCDSVPSFPTREAIRVIEQELGQNVNDIFFNFNNDTLPIAAASLGQVYKLKLKNGKNGFVAVKVQRPDMLHSVLRDIFIMRCLVRVIEKVKGLVTRQKAFDVALLDSFAAASLQELDYLNEAANQEKFRQDLVPKLGGRVYIPEVHHEFTTRKVLVTEWIDGEKLASSSKDTINRLIPVGLECFLSQLLETGYFHADPHPGNLLVTPDGKLALIDFGLCAEVPMPDARTLTLSIVHMMQGDMSGMIDDAIDLGFLPSDVDRASLQPTMQKLYDNATSVARDDSAEFKSIETRRKRFMAISFELNKIFFAFPFCVPDYFALLTRAMIVLEGIAVSGNPEFDLFSSAYPYAFKRAVNVFGFSDLSQIAAQAVKNRFARK